MKERENKFLEIVLTKFASQAKNIHVCVFHCSYGYKSTGYLITFEYIV